MTEHSSNSIDLERPAVLILTAGSAAEATTSSVLWGLEEEGIPSELRQVASGEAEHLAKQAADASRLGVGVGVQESEGRVVLHHRDLPAGRPLFTLSSGDIQSAKLRVLGMNAARLVKGEPLVFNDPAAGCGKAKHSDPYLSSDAQQLIEVVVRIVLELLHDHKVTL